MIRPRYPTLACLLILGAAGCARQEPPQGLYQPSSSQAETAREFLSEAQARHARYYWSAVALEPYGVHPADSERTLRGI